MITAFKVKATSTVQNVSECFFFFIRMRASEPQNILSLTKLGMVVQHHEPACRAEKSCLLSSRVSYLVIWRFEAQSTTRDYIRGGGDFHKEISSSLKSEGS